MAHKWDKSSSTVWPLVCSACGVEGRVKPGTAGAMQYRLDASPWRKKIPCAPFTCCGGSDERPPRHTQDCQHRSQ